MDPSPARPSSRHGTAARERHRRTACPYRSAGACPLIYFDYSGNIVDERRTHLILSNQIIRQFRIYRRMAPARISHARAVRALDTRLKVHRLLVQAGQDGLSAGFIARKLGLPASSLSFHLMHLQTAELVTQRRAGRSLIYAVDFAVMDGLMAYLQENCCIGVASESCDADGCAAEKTKIEETSL